MKVAVAKSFLLESYGEELPGLLKKIARGGDGGIETLRHVSKESGLSEQMIARLARGKWKAVRKALDHPRPATHDGAPAGHTARRAVATSALRLTSMMIEESLPRRRQVTFNTVPLPPVEGTVATHALDENPSVGSPQVHTDQPLRLVVLGGKLILKQGA